MTIDHFTLKLFLRYVTTTVLYTNPRLHVVELAAVEFEKFEQKNTQVSVGVGIVSRMELKKADAHENKRV